MPTVPPFIAVVDDEESVRRALGRLMRAAGFVVESYPSGAAFLHGLESRVPACVVLDLHMPGVSGFEVQAQIARSGRRVPCVVVTGHDSPAIRARVLNAGAHAFLRKPVDEVTLLDAVNAAIAGPP